MHKRPDSSPLAEILVVDDNPANLTLLAGMLTEEGYEVRAALSGTLAIGAAQAAAPDLILLDVNMPGMNGFDVCQALKADPRTRHVPIIFISALDAIGDKVAAFEVGGVDYVTKPFQIREVLARVSTQLTLYRQREQLVEQRRELEDRHLQIQKLQSILRGYLSGRAWDSIVSGAASPEPEQPARETLTILVSDIEGFVRLSEQTDPAVLLADLDAYMTLLARSVGEHTGDVDKYLGDGMLAFFKHASPALRAACLIQERVAEFNKRRGAEGLLPFPTRIGLATGQVLLGSIGSGIRREFTIIGDSVNMASRLQSEGPAGGILMDEETFVSVGRPMDAVASLIHIKGKTDPVSVYELPAECLIDLDFPN